MRATVLFDASCGMCRRFQRAGEWLDWLGLIEWLPSRSPEAARFGISSEDLDRAMHVAAGRSIASGFGAVKRILLRLPLFYLAAVVMFLIEPWSVLAVAFLFSPLFAPAGEWLYRRAARGRSCGL